ncbi:hypothetical protein RJ639_005300 [Escallonia herrerae]|uniref:Uncharacterized protein n=1 Tax=Escallonia herrerae TaxID=1293975 RepID=A0AA88VWV5_9ASTE|nr:hypothetical protein RJ639_005300 [Escallonia herrerae]
MGGGTKEAVSEKEEEQAQVDIWKYVFGFTEVAVVKCAIELGIADVLETHDGPMPLSDLSSALRCSPAVLYRIMRFLIHRGIFKETSTGEDVAGYVQTPLSRLLMRHGPNSMAAFVLFESSPVMMAPWHCLSARVLAAGTSAFEAAHGDDVWQYAASNPAHSKLLDEAMACDARVAVPAIIGCAPEVFEGLGSLVDVGGGDGTSLGMVVKACPWIRGINFDLPHVVSLAPNCDGIEHVAGNMFDSIPKADAAYLMWVLHDWGDDECIHILKKCREAIPQDTGKVIIVEAVIGEREGDKLKDVALLLDMVMMAHTNKGKERTLDEWARVLCEAGFSRHTVKHIRAVQSVIEAYP